MPEVNESFVSIITVNYDQPTVTGQLLQSLQRIQYQNIEILVVDNGSPSQTTDELVVLFPNVHFLKSDINTGFAGGNNLAVQKAKGDYLLFINNDTEVDPDFLAPLIRCFHQHPGAGMASPKINYFAEKNLIQYAGSTDINPYSGRNRCIGQGQPDHGQFNDVRQTAFIHGAAMLVGREVLEQVGPMEESFFLYYEELDWCARARRAGFTIWYVGESVIYHKESVSTGQNSPFKLYYLTRNRLLFMWRNFPTHQWLISFFFFSFISLPKHLLSFALKRQFKHVTAFWKAYWWNLSRMVGKGLGFTGQGTSNL
ncbi:MAG: glycosyltransferase family 2 protein [Cytophagaceae bacterium]|nr:glycosyltransferase family 2 protein [Cytophagaceae bacterium]